MKSRFSELHQEYEALGYNLVRFPGPDYTGKQWKYARYPNGAGSTMYFDDLGIAEANIKSIKQIRWWQTDILSGFGRMV